MSTRLAPYDTDALSSILRPAVRVADIEFTYSQPDVSVDTATRTVKHDTLTDTAVVQKIGRDPRNIEISGMCTTIEAHRVDDLAQFDQVEVRSARFSGPALIEDTSTSPRKEIRYGQHLHDFTINLTEIA